MNETCECGRLLFLLFAFACTHIRHDRGQISDDDYETLKTLVKGWRSPPEDLLERCFPKAFDDLRTFAEKRGADMWSLLVVSTFWIEHRGTSPVEIGKICSVEKPFAMVALEDGSRTVRAFNLYKLALRKGMRVALHQDMVVLVLK